MTTKETYREIEVADGTYLNPLPIGTKIRSKQHPELTGRIKAYEWNKPGVLSAIPYLIGWDDSGRAADTLGWFFVYATPAGIEEVQA